MVQQYDGRVRLVVKDFPLASHSLARPAHEAARCAAQGGRFWPYRDRLFDAQPRFEREDLAPLRRRSRSRSRNGSCSAWRPATFAAAVEADVSQGRALGVRGTPTFLINGQLLVGSPVGGDLPARHRPGPGPEALMPFRRVASPGDIPAGQGLLVELNGLSLAVFNGETVASIACGGVCPHEDGPLAEGWLEGEAVVCPWHGFDFDLETGHCRVDPELSIPVFAVRVTDDAVEVDLP